MANIICINMSGESVPVFSDPEKTQQVGEIMYRETFGYNRNWGGDDYNCQIKFRGPSGNVRYGFIIDPPNNSMTECTEYPYESNVFIGNKYYYTFIMRQTMNVYDISGNYWGRVARNCRVACLTALSGDSHPDWKAINKVERTDGVWIDIDESDDRKYGFVDIGLGYASGCSSIPFYGSW